MREVTIKELDDMTFGDLYVEDEYEMYPNITNAFKKLSQKVRVKRTPKYNALRPKQLRDESHFLLFPTSSIQNIHLRHHHS